MSECKNCTKYEEMIAQKDATFNQFMEDAKAVMEFDDKLREKYTNLLGEHFASKYQVESITHIESRGGRIYRRPEQFVGWGPTCGDKDQHILYCDHNDKEKIITLIGSSLVPNFSMQVLYCPFCGFSYKKDEQ